MLTPSNSESDDPIESSSSMLETVVGRAFRRGERLSALAAPVSTAFPGPGSIESVANDVSGTDFAPQRTCEIETSAILHFGSALTMRELCLRNSGSNSSTQTLPRPERVAIRKELARKARADFYARLDSWKDGGETEPPRVFRRVFYLSPASARPDLCRRSYQCSKSVGGISSIGPRPVPKLSPFEIDHKSAA